MSSMLKKNMSFEEAFERLVEISQELEKADHKNLEESIKLYEESAHLKKFCEEFIEKTKLRIESINKDFNPKQQANNE